MAKENNVVEGSPEATEITANQVKPAETVDSSKIVEQAPLNRLAGPIPGPSSLKKENIVVKSSNGTKINPEEYFFNGLIPSSFEKSCGKPVEREDLIEVFHKVFSPDDKFLFYKNIDKEVYIIVVPIKFGSTIGAFNDSIPGDFQKHAISFLQEGSVNADTLEMKLKRIVPFCNFSKK